MALANRESDPQVERPTMARFSMLILLLFAAALANESSNKVVETRKVAEEQTKLANATNEKLDQLAKTVEQHHNQTLEYVMQQNQKLDQFPKEMIISAQCMLARSATLHTLSNGKKYHFNRTSDNTWFAVNETCARLGLHMATITDLRDAKVVSEEGERIIGSYAPWVSAKNQGRGSKRDFRWQDGTKLELNSPLWEHDADKTQDCVYIFKGNKNKLNTLQCFATSRILCELPRECY
ncbi:uncharacterized protein LOC132194004 isoform X2 [Neocloeon triangulifer]|uniref:uncharacterized protein LOC132194004 isoform X2 n=1 Tax=Neocloeon triangulifer TaxID=2078957 RepID=UPI00286F8C0E|nr:uncharacterized protein LOC132194004 isoform X2 [Neocloeon triangulifer]